MRPIVESDIDTILTWYSNRGLFVNKDIFPKSGFMVDDICACFLYLSMDGIAMIEGVVSNPKSNPFDVRRAIIKMIDGVTKFAESLGVKFIVGLASSNGMINIGKKLGYEDRGTYRVLMKGF